MTSRRALAKSAPHTATVNAVRQHYRQWVALAEVALHRPCRPGAALNPHLKTRRPT